MTVGSNVKWGIPFEGQNGVKASDDLSSAEVGNVKLRYQSDFYDSDEEENVYRLHKKIVKSLISPDRTDTNVNKVDVNESMCRSVRLKSDGDGRNIIHRAILELKKKNLSAPEKALDFIENIVLEKPALFTAKDMYSKIPMLEAAKLHVTILFRIIDILIPQSTLRQIKSRCQAESGPCPLWKVRQGRRDRCRKQTNRTRTDNVESAERRHRMDPERTRQTAQIEHGIAQDHTQCLHDKIDVDKLLSEDYHLREILKAGLMPEKVDVYAPITCLQSLLTESKFDRGQKDNSQVIQLDGFKVLLELYPEEIFTTAAPNEHSPLQMAVRLYDKESIDYRLLFSVIEALVERSPRSIFFKSGHGKDARTVYRLLKELKKPSSSENAQSRKQVEDLLKNTCIGTRRGFHSISSEGTYDDLWAAKKEFLYWDPKLEQQFYLNLTGESVILDETYITTVIDQSGMCFESVLDFVKLPYWKPEDLMPRSKMLNQSTTNKNVNSNWQTESNVQSDVKIKTDPYKDIFRWLWASGVRKIFTVEVDDDGPEPHTNAAIREALRGKNPKNAPTRDFEIEVWKWKKFDICSETIVTAAPAAKEVHLFSYGNTAVLRGWASTSGLARLSKLERLYIEIFPKNADDESDCRDYEEMFKESLVNKCSQLRPENITITNHGSHFGQADPDNRTIKDSKSGIQRINLEKIPKSKEWIKQLDEFKSFMLNLGLSEKPSVKVALLDDGCKLTDLHGKQRGRSFSRDNKEYFVGDCEHGTQMATCIREVCPMAELYIARLDDSRICENQKFTIASCHEALKWALDMEVDIISMSWTFERKGGTNDEHERKFVELIEAAVASKKVILFGALPDKGPMVETHQFAPVGIQDVIRIGSATDYGETSQENLHAKPDFLLPGEKLQFQPGKYVRGSSYATAYAAGLAAMVLYCLKANGQLDEDPQDDHPLAKAVALAKTIDGMTAIFRRLSQKNPEEKSDRGVFVKPYITFGKDFSSTGTKEKVLASIVNDMLPRSVLAALQHIVS